MVRCEAREVRQEHHPSNCRLTPQVMTRSKTAPCRVENKERITMPRCHIPGQPGLNLYRVHHLVSRKDVVIPVAGLCGLIKSLVI